MIETKHKNNLASKLHSLEDYNKAKGEASVGYDFNYKQITI